MNKEKEERKKLVEERRKEFKENPEEFIKTHFIGKLIQEWKTNPLQAIGQLLYGILSMYIIFGLIIATNNDMIYCDSTIPKYDGKLMHTFNAFVKEYNEQAIKIRDTTSPLNSELIAEKLNTLNHEYSIICDYNLKQWSEDITTNKGITEWLIGYKKILLKEK